jgi:hypothetical protein
MGGQSKRLGIVVGRPQITSLAGPLRLWLVGERFVLPQPFVRSQFHAEVKGRATLGQLRDPRRLNDGFGTRVRRMGR